MPLQRYAALLRTYLAPQRARVGLLAATLLGSIGLQLAAPQILRRFIDTARAGGEPRTLTELALLFLGVGLANQLAAAAAAFLGAIVGWTATNRLREDVADHCLHLDLTFHNQHTPGQMIERVDGDVTHLSNFFSQLVIQILGGVLLCTGILVCLFLENPIAGAVLTGFALVALAILWRCRDLAVPAAKATREASSRLFGFLEEKLSGLEDIRANGGGPYVLDRFFRVNHRFYHASRKSWMLHATLFMIVMGLFVTGYALALGLGVYLYQAGAVTLGTVFLFLHYTQMLRGPLQQITHQFQDLQNATAGISRVDELLLNRQRMQDGPGVDLPSGPLCVAFENVTFAYPGGDPVLKDLSFEIDAGRTLGLIGRTGSGKSTIARLLFRLYDPNQGQVELGGQPLSAFAMTDLRHRIGMVTQEVQIFDATVLENLAFFAGNVAREQVLDVADTLGLREWYESMPQGLDTPLESGGGNLSAGEAQLLAFTRIFLSNPGLIILDEPSSRMDPVTERMVRRAIQRLLNDRTAIVIAHRLTTLEMVDDILLLEDGRKVEYGPRDALAGNLDSRYRQLLDLGLGEVAP